MRTTTKNPNQVDNLQPQYLWSTLCLLFSAGHHSNFERTTWLTENYHPHFKSRETYVQRGFTASERVAQQVRDRPATQIYIVFFPQLHTSSSAWEDLLTTVWEADLDPGLDMRPGSWGNSPLSPAFLSAWLLESVNQLLVRRACTC